MKEFGKRFVTELKDKSNWKKAIKMSLILFAIKEAIGMILYLV